MPNPRKPAQPARETHEQATIRMVNDPGTWPHLALPLKKWEGNTLKIAVLFASLGKPHQYQIARGANLFSQVTSVTLEPITPDAVLAEGWLVD